MFDMVIEMCLNIQHDFYSCDGQGINALKCLCYLCVCM